MSLHTFDLTTFQATFPEFAATNPVALAAYWDMATQYLNPNDGCMLSGRVLQLALNFTTAHLAKLMALAGAGKTSGVATGATEGSVSVSMAPPPFRSGWEFWLSTTPYGLQLWALLQVQTAGGTFIGPSLERASFRKAGGVF